MLKHLVNNPTRQLSKLQLNKRIAIESSQVKNGFPTSNNTTRKVTHSGFSLVELMIATGIISILAGVAIPSYISYTRNGEASEALATLINLSTRMEQRFLDDRNFDTGDSCALASPSVDNYTFSCTSSGRDYTWTATSNDDQRQYNIDQAGNKTTTKYAGAESTRTCWVLNNGGCF